MQDELDVRTITSAMFAENAYVLRLRDRADCLVVDPGFDAELIKNHLTDNSLTLKAILNTHGHFDHVAGNALLKRCWPEAAIVIGAKDENKLQDPTGNLSGDFGPGMTSPPANETVREGDAYEAAGMTLHVLELPGHTCGHVGYVWKTTSPWMVLAGDVLFQGGIGRSDFPDGDGPTLLASIRDKLFAMPDDTVVLPGHGATTTTGTEKRFNPYVGEQAGGEGFPDFL